MGARQKRKPKEKWVPPQEPSLITKPQKLGTRIGINLATGAIVRIGNDYVKLDSFPRSGE